GVEGADEIDGSHHRLHRTVDRAGDVFVLLVLQALELHIYDGNRVLDCGELGGFAIGELRLASGVDVEPQILKLKKQPLTQVTRRDSDGIHLAYQLNGAL